MHHPIDRITHTMAFVTPVVEHWLERENAELLLGAPVVRYCVLFFGGMKFDLFLTSNSSLFSSTSKHSSNRNCLSIYNVRLPNG